MFTTQAQRHKEDPDKECHCLLGVLGVLAVQYRIRGASLIPISTAPKTRKRNETDLWQPAPVRFVSFVLSWLNVGFRKAWTGLTWFRVILE
jgi:hypothetical protein